MRHLVITGASGGIGRATVETLADEFERVTIVGRSPARHQGVLHAVAHADLVECELGSLRSVAHAASIITGDIDVLVANAAVGGGRGTTADGFEHHFGINHLAHHLLVTRLAERITDRVVMVSSEAHRGVGGIDYDGVTTRTRSLTGYPEYRRSKLANVLFGRELARRTGVTTHIVHPGVASSRIWRRVPQPFRAILHRRMMTPEQASVTPVWAATATGLESGGYYSRCAPRQPDPAALDNEAAAELWERSQRWVGPFRLAA